MPFSLRSSNLSSRKQPVSCTFALSACRCIRCGSVVSSGQGRISSAGRESATIFFHYSRFIPPFSLLVPYTQQPLTPPSTLVPNIYSVL